MIYIFLNSKMRNPEMDILSCYSILGIHIYTTSTRNITVLTNAELGRGKGAISSHKMPVIVQKHDLTRFTFPTTARLHGCLRCLLSLYAASLNRLSGFVVGVLKAITAAVVVFAGPAKGWGRRRWHWLWRGRDSGGGVVATALQLVAGNAVIRVRIVRDAVFLIF